MHNQDRELQIKLAELQSDIQICLTNAFGLIAGFLTFFVALMQIYYSLPWEESFTSVRNLVGILMFIIFCVWWILPFSYIKKAIVARKKIAELKREYCW